MQWKQLHPTDFQGRVSKALELVLDYSDMARRAAVLEKFKILKPAAVLLLFGFVEDEPALLFTKRSELVEQHKGQMAFPGGYCEPEDLQKMEVTALRETEEEVGIPHHLVKILGHLPSLPTISGFLIHPVVGMLNVSIETIELKLSAAEIDEAIWIPLRTLTEESIYRLEKKDLGLFQFPIHVYQVGRHRIWGATGAMTKNFLDRLQSLV